MAAPRLTLPVTSATIATVLGLGVAATIVIFSHPTPVFGIISAVAVSCGSLLLAGGFAATRPQTPLRVAIAGIVVYVALLMVVGGVGLALFSVPIITVLAAGTAIVGAILLSFVVTGYTDPTSLRTHIALVAYWVAILFGIGVIAVLITVIVEVIFDQGVGVSASRPVETVVKSSSGAMAYLLIYFIAISMLLIILIKQLNRLGLLTERRGNQLRWRLFGVMLVVAALLFLPASLGNSRSAMQGITDFSSGLATILNAIGGAVQAPSLHWFFISTTVVLLSVTCLCFLLRALRQYSSHQVALLTGYLIVPLTAIASLTIGFGTGIQVASNVVGPDAVRQLENSPLGSPFVIFVQGTRTTLLAPLKGPGHIFSARIAAWAFIGFGLMLGLLISMVVIKGVMAGLYRFESRGLPAAASAGLFTGAAFLGLTGTWPPVVAGCLVGAMLTWDVLENGVGLGEQLDHRFNAVPNELAHLLASSLVGVVAVAVGLGTYELAGSLTAGEVPSILVVGLLLSAGVVFALLLRRV